MPRPYYSSMSKCLLACTRDIALEQYRTVPWTNHTEKVLVKGWLMALQIGYKDLISGQNLQKHYLKDDHNATTISENQVAWDMYSLTLYHQYCKPQSEYLHSYKLHGVRCWIVTVFRSYLLAHTSCINYWNTHKPVRFMLSYVLSVTCNYKQRTAWKVSLQSIQLLRKIQENSLVKYLTKYKKKFVIYRQ